MNEKPLALVVGASRGLGFALALEICATHRVVAVARTAGGLEELDDRIQERGGSATLAPLDIRDPDAVAAFCAGLLERWGRLDVWLHAAIHAPPLAPAGAMDDSDWSSAMDANATAAARLVPPISRLLGEAGVAAFFDDPDCGRAFHGAYGASKAAQIALARSWKAESARIGPRVEILVPRPMPTALRARFHPGENRDALHETGGEAKRLLAELGLR